MQERGTLRVRARPEADALIVEIGDSGPGIPKDIQRQIFEPFFTTKPQGEGTGLGLDIVRGIAARHQGSVRVLHSAPGDTVLQVRLPISQAATTEQAQMAITCQHRDQDTHPAPRTTGCEECLQSGERWVHLRLCLDSAATWGVAIPRRTRTRRSTSTATRAPAR